MNPVAPHRNEWLLKVLLTVVTTASIGLIGAMIAMAGDVKVNANAIATIQDVQRANQLTMTGIAEVLNHIASRQERIEARQELVLQRLDRIEKMRFKGSASTQ